MTDWLEKYREYEIEIQYLTDNAMYSDRGFLTDFSSQWVEITKNRSKRNQEILVVPVYAIRIIKILSPPENQANHLLRPATPPTNQGQGFRRSDHV
jgi:hypothetical protein